MLQPVVSVIVPAYNVRGCIEKAIRSALAQRGVAVEVIVVDDCSTDGTAEFVAERFAGIAEVKLFCMAQNRGPAAARNRGFREASGEWLALLDADDWWKPGRLRTLLDRADQYDFVADNIMGFDVAHGRETWPIYPAGEDTELRLLDFLAPIPADRHDYGYLQPVLRRSRLESMGLSYREDLRSGEDLLFCLQFLINGGRALFVNEPLYVYALPVGPISRKASPYSKTQAKNDMLIKALATLRVRYRHRLTPTEDEALANKIHRFEAAGPISEFHHARVNLDLVSMLKLILFEKRVQAEIIARIFRRIPSPFVLPLLYLLLDADLFVV